MQIIPLSAVPSQVISVLLGQQSCQISVRQRDTGLYLDLSVAGTIIVSGKLCTDGVPLIPSYAGFTGQLTFLDTKGDQNPEYSGLDDRFVLGYTP